MELHILNRTNTVANHYLAEMRDINIQKDRMRFRKNLRRLGFVMAYEFSKQLKFGDTSITTPLGTASVGMVQSDLYLITILRAGLPFYEGFLEAFDQIDSGFVGAYRAAKSNNTKDPDIQLDYLATDVLTDKEVLFVDPMLATGNSLVKAINALIAEKGQPKKLHIFSAIGTQYAVDQLNEKLKVPGTIWMGAMDETLNEKAYIIPGLGDAGDLSYGTKS